MRSSNFHMSKRAGSHLEGSPLMNVAPSFSLFQMSLYNLTRFCGSM